MAVLTEAQRWRKDASDAAAALTEATQAPEFSAAARAELLAALTRLELDRPIPAHEDMEDRSAEAGMLWLDAPAANHLAGLGAAGQGYAAKLRQAATSRWMGRFAPSTDLWLQWRRPAGGAWPPFVRLLVRAVEGGGATVPKAPATAVQPSPCAGTVTTPRVPMIALPVANALLDALGPGGPEGTSQNIDAHRFIRWFAAEVQTRGGPHGDLLAVESWAALAADIGGSDRTRKLLPRVVEAFERLVVQTDAGPVRILLRHAIVSGVRIDLVPGPGVSPEIAPRLRGGDRRLVPMLPLPTLPGNPRERAGLAALQMALVIRVRERAAGLAGDGGATLTPGDLRHLALRTGLTTAALGRTMASWPQCLAGEGILVDLATGSVTLTPGALAQVMADAEADP